MHPGARVPGDRGKPDPFPLLPAGDACSSARLLPTIGHQQNPEDKDQAEL